MYLYFEQIRKELSTKNKIRFIQIIIAFWLHSQIKRALLCLSKVQRDEFWMFNPVLTVFWSNLLSCLLWFWQSNYCVLSMEIFVQLYWSLTKALQWGLRKAKKGKRHIILYAFLLISSIFSGLISKREFYYKLTAF